MPEKSKSYPVKFPYDTIQAAYKEYIEHIDSDRRAPRSSSWEISYTNGETWKYDNEVQFVNGYTKDNVSNISLHRSFDDNQGFYINSRYDFLDNGFKTRISISLLTVEAIERVFSIFEDHFREIVSRQQLIKEESIRNATLTSSFYNTKFRLPSCYLEKRTVSELEKYVLDRINQLNFIEKDKLKHQVRIVDSLGVTTSPSISNYQRDLFDNGIHHVVLEFSSSLSANEISIRFAKTKDESYTEISFRGDNARDIVESIRGGILKKLEEVRNSNHLYYPPFLLDVILATFTFALGAALVLAAINKVTIPNVLIGVALLMAVYEMAHKIKPYTTFATPRNNEIRKWNRSIVEILLGIIITWIIYNIYPWFVKLFTGQ